MTERFHLIGIGGIGMSALASILLARGAAVSGSDAQGSDTTARLLSQGAKVSIGHKAELVEGAQRLVVSDAIQPDNPELLRAKQLGLPIQRRSQLLAELMEGSRGLAVAGTHGKTTVTAMVAAMLVEAGMDPTVALGGRYEPVGGNARAGRGPWFVVEACEAYESFLDLRPEIALITNMEAEHLDHHGTEAHLRAAFRSFLHRLLPGGCAVLCADRPELREIGADLDCEVITYGTETDANVRGTEVATAGSGMTCDLSLDGRPVGALRLGVPGAHNLLNALGALAAARRAGAPLAACQSAMAAFHGVDRRFQIIGDAGGILVIDDYAHHPTEIAATIDTARAAFPGRRLIAVFQPHLYSRTRDFAEGFSEALGKADLAVLTDIYAAREAPLPGVTVDLISKPLRARRGEDVVLQMAKEEAATKLASQVQTGDVVLVMGAGDIGQAAWELARRLGIEPTGRPEVATKE